MTCVFINHGLLRKGEPEQVEEVFTKQFDVDFIHVHAEDGLRRAPCRRDEAGAEAPHHRHAVGRNSLPWHSSSRPMASR